MGNSNRIFDRAFTIDSIACESMLNELSNMTCCYASIGYEYGSNDHDESLMQIASDIKCMAKVNNMSLGFLAISDTLFEDKPYIRKKGYWRYNRLFSERHPGPEFAVSKSTPIDGKVRLWSLLPIPPGDCSYPLMTMALMHRSCMFVLRDDGHFNTEIIDNILRDTTSGIDIGSKGNRTISSSIISRMLLSGFAVVLVTFGWDAGVVYANLVWDERTIHLKEMVWEKQSH